MIPAFTRPSNSVILTEGKDPRAKRLVQEWDNRVTRSGFAGGCFAAAQHDG